MTPRAFQFAMRDWYLVERDRQFFSLPAEAMSSIGNPQGLRIFPWEVDNLSTDIDWERIEKKYSEKGH